MKTYLLAGFATLAVTASAHAQNPPPPPGQPGPVYGYGAGPYSHHRGFMIGFGLGFGSQVASCDNCDAESGFGFDFNIGGFINPRVAIMYDASGVMSFHTFAGIDFQLTNSVNTVSARYWVAPAAWIQGGAGFGRMILTGDNIDAIESESAAALTVAAGYEVSQSRSMSIDVRLRIGHVFYDDTVFGDITNVSLSAGFSWH